MEAVIDLLVGGTDIAIGGFVFLCAIAFLGSFVTAAFGLGGGVLALASMSMVLSPAVLIPLNGVVQLGSNSGRAFLMRADIMVPLILPFLVGTLIGAAFGGHFVVTLPTGVLQIILGGFIIYTMWGPKLKASKPGKKTFFFVGLGGAFATMFVGATGPLVAPFVAAASDKRQEVVATHGALMTMQHGLKVVVFGVLGFAFGPYIPLLIAMLGLGFFGTWVGKHTLNKLPEQAFRFIFKWGITALAVRLLYKGIVG